ncbi:Endonuclease/exonuclease/phosphatase [Trema orientale]|uniref:Endonuclease/exonuclease/phosphatase n=1 Tax=Trema orientale TaxID=63057 RepID=A0A2P5FY46_TREOI|nr:Endonuclease/exonuclease/phosphatase [Trema orientale]
METKMDAGRMGTLWRRLGFFEAVIIPAVGLSRGLCLMWKRGVDIDIISNFNSQIVSSFREPPASTGWYLYFTYAPPQRQHRRQFWHQFTSEVLKKEGCWACIGDLNCVLSAEEKLGGRKFCTYEGAGLREFLFSTGSIDLGSVGAWYTWSNGYELTSLIKERLD